MLRQGVANASGVACSPGNEQSGREARADNAWSGEEPELANTNDPGRGRRDGAELPGSPLLSGKGLGDTEREQREGRSSVERDSGEQLPAAPRASREYYPGWPRGRGPIQHDWEPPRLVPSQREMDKLLDGSPERLAADQNADALRALGNGVVPATAAKAFVTLINKFL